MTLNLGELKFATKLKGVLKGVDLGSKLLVILNIHLLMVNSLCLDYFKTIWFFFISFFQYSISMLPCFLFVHPKRLNFSNIRKPIQLAVQNNHSYFYFFAYSLCNSMWNIQNNSTSQCWTKQKQNFFIIESNKNMTYKSLSHL